MRKWASMYGTNHCDQQGAHLPFGHGSSRVARTLGYGAMTNSYNDLNNTKHDLHGLECGRAHRSRWLTRCTPRSRGQNDRGRSAFTRTALGPPVRSFRPGTDVALMFGML